MAASLVNISHSLQHGLHLPGHRGNAGAATYLAGEQMEAEVNTEDFRRSEKW